jgi:hypothetical protein
MLIIGEAASLVEALRIVLIVPANVGLFHRLQLN